jgi:cytochrome c peroxidase
MPLWSPLLLLACAGTGDDSSTTDSVTPTDSDTPTETADTGGPSALDVQLAELLATLDDPPVALDPAPALDPALVALGQALFWDPVLSGNQDTACVSCHHPEHGLSDGLVLSLGTGSTGVGPTRKEGERGAWIARHAPALYNMGHAGQDDLFWDGRVAVIDGIVTAPTPIPDGLSGALAAQALHPILDADEMAGQAGENEVADAADAPAKWAALVARLRTSDGYEALFAAAWPELAVEDWSITQVGNALEAYQTDAFRADGSPWDQYLAGDTTALDDSETLGALLFYSGGCSDCHSGALLTDGRFHNTAVPQLTPGVGDAAPYDFGREGVSGSDADRYAFRTPSLRNVALSAPYMHDGTMADLGDALSHYAHPDTSARDYDASDLDPELQAFLRQDEAHLVELLDTLSPDMPDPDTANTVGLSNLRQFLEALTDPAWQDTSALVPESVPSGLPVPR